MGESVRIGDVEFHPMTATGVVELIRDDLGSGRGGWVVTPNSDILMKCHRDDGLRRIVEAASLRLADGAPVVWASRLAGHPLPERVTGAELLPLLADMAAAEGKVLSIVGGRHGVAEQAAHRLRATRPGLRIGIAVSPSESVSTDPDEIEAIARQLSITGTDIAAVCLGFPKQEQVIARLRDQLPATWFLGAGAAVDFAAGTAKRAPGILQKSGGEWLFRLAQEPARLGPRYLHDLPFVLTLFGGAIRSRIAGLRRGGVRNPGVRNPGVRNPGVRNPGVRNPGARNPGGRTSGRRTP